MAHQAHTFLLCLTLKIQEKTYTTYTNGVTV